MDTEELKAMIDNEPNDVLDMLSTGEVAGYYDSSQCDDGTGDTYSYDDSSQKWYKSWAVWLSIAGLISIIFTSTGLFEKIGITSETFNIIVEAIGTILTAFGIINNPTVKGRLS